MWSTLPVSHSFQQNGYHIINIAAVYHYQILNKKSIRRVPTTMQYSWGKIQEIFDLLVIDLSKARFNRIVCFFLLDFTPQLLDRSWNYTFSFILFIDLTSKYLLFSSHCVGFAWPSLSICKNGSAVTFNCCINQLINIASLIAFLLIIARTHYIVELIAFLRASWLNYRYFWAILRVF